jgi:uncharacterized protein DUF2652
MNSKLCVNGKAEVRNALILIPDISGFTDYIMNTDLEHSQLNIAALLESILESNTLGLQVSEIEGDAILFYSFNIKITLEEIINQCSLMLSNFHKKLLEIGNLDCQCGSCEKLAKLTLKFIIHFGDLGSVMVKNFCKLYGKDLIIAHALLKNKIPLKEYIVFTEKAITTFGKKQLLDFVDKRNINKLEHKTENFDPINLTYFQLSSINRG